MVEAIHIHEDDLGMRNLYPIAGADEARAELRAAHNAGERNRIGPGIYSVVHLIEHPSIDYTSVGLSLATAASTLEAIMPRVKRFNATVGLAMDYDIQDSYGSYETEAWCFGLHENCFIKLEPKDELVAHIWFEWRGTKASDCEKLRAAIEAVDRLAPSYLVDFWLNFACPADPASLNQYFEAHAAHAAEVERRIREQTGSDKA